MSESHLRRSLRPALRHRAGLFITIVLIATSAAVEARPPTARRLASLATTPAVAPGHDVYGLVFEESAIDQGTAERIFASAEAALYLPGLGRVRWFERGDVAVSAAQDLHAQPLSSRQLSAFQQDLVTDFPGYRLGAFGEFLLKFPSTVHLDGDAAIPVPPIRPASVTPQPLSVIFTDSFESGNLGTNWVDATNFQGDQYKWTTTTCDAHTGSRSADPVRGGSAGGTLSCSANYPNSAVMWMYHNACESMAGAPQAWVDAWVKYSLDSTYNDFFGFYYSDPGGSGNLYGYGFIGSVSSWAHVVANLKQWPTLGDITALSCPRLTIYFSSDASTAGGYGLRVDDVKISTDPPSFLNVSIGANPSSGAAPLAVAFTANVSGSAGSETFRWSFDGSNTSTTRNPTFTYTAPGDYSPQLYVFDAAGTNAYSRTKIHVDAQAACQLACTATVPATAASGAAVSFQSTAAPTNCTGGPATAWSFGDNQTSTAQNPSHTYASGGTYAWTLTVTLGSVTCTKNGTITISAPPSTLPGDCNGDGAVSIGEVQNAINMVLGTVPFGCGVASLGDLQRVINAFLGASGPQTSQFGIVYGTVRNLAGAYLADVTVAIGAKTGQTNGQGYFTITDVPASDRALVRFSKPGFVPTTTITKVVTGQGSYLDVNIAQAETQGTIPATSGGTVQTGDGGSVTIPPNGLVTQSGQPFTGTATVSVTTFDPTDPAQLNSFPGAFEGVTHAGQTIPFVSFGWMDVTVTDSTNAALQLAAGKTATLQIPVASAIQSAAPATIPQWYFNPADSLWHEEGTFTLASNKASYQGTIPHFSIWNCDVGTDRCTVHGRVVDLSGNPVKGARVTMRNLGPRGRFTSGESSTPDSGVFDIPVDANSRVEYWAEKGGTKSQTNPAPQTDTCTNGGIRNVGDIVLGTLPVKITLTWNSEPRDLDSHLAIPKAAGGGWFHYDYDQEPTKYEDCVLDTDDRDGYGPEIFSVYLLHTGTYRYSVHHFAGTGGITTSGANVNLVVEGRGIYTFTPPAGATASKDVWHVFDMKVDAARNVTVVPLGDVLHNDSDSDAPSFTPPN